MTGASRPGVAHATRCCIVNGIRNVPKRAAYVVARHAVVVGQFNHRAALLIAITDERERIFLLGAIRGAQRLHAHHAGVEIDRALNVANVQHGLENSHWTSSLNHEYGGAAIRGGTASERRRRGLDPILFV